MSVQDCIAQGFAFESQRVMADATKYNVIDNSDSMPRISASGSCFTCVQ